MCSAADIDPKWLSFDNIPRKSSKEMSLEIFRSEFEDKNLPVIITDCASEWEIMKNLSSDALRSEFGKTRFHCAGFDFSLEDYLDYSSKVKDDQPLYLFDKVSFLIFCAYFPECFIFHFFVFQHFAKKAPEIAARYEVPEYFSDDLFKVMGEENRPDWRWLIIGPRKSGSTFHKVRTFAFQLLSPASSHTLRFYRIQTGLRPGMRVLRARNSGSFALPISLLLESWHLRTGARWLPPCPLLNGWYVLNSFCSSSRQFVLILVFLFLD